MAKAKAAKSGVQAVKEALDFLAKYDKPEVTTKLTGDERQKYLKALDIAFGPKQQRMADMGFSPQVYYHGSFFDIDRFDPKKFDKSAAVGRGVYLTSDPQDAFSNYADKSGPDVQAKIERAIKNPSIDSFQKQKKTAEKRLYKTLEKEGVLYPLHIRSKKMADLGPDQGQHFIELLNVAGDDVVLSKEAKAIKEALWRARDKYENFHPDKAWSAILENDLPTETELWKSLRRETGDASDKITGNLVGNEINRLALKAAGFDAISLEPVTKGKPAVSFGYHYKAEPQTKHITVFNPNQVRSTNAAFDPRFKKSPLIMAGKAAAVLGATGAAEQAMAGLTPNEFVANAGEAFDKYISQPVQGLAKETLTPTFSVRGQEVKTSTPVTDMIIEGGFDPVNVMGGAGEVIDIIRMLRELRQKKAVEQ